MPYVILGAWTQFPLMLFRAILDQGQWLALNTAWISTPLPLHFIYLAYSAHKNPRLKKKKKVSEASTQKLGDATMAGIRHTLPPDFGWQQIVRLGNPRLWNGVFIVATHHSSHPPLFALSPMPNLSLSYFSPTLAPYSTPGVGKILPMGQIQPTRLFYQACRAPQNLEN